MSIPVKWICWLNPNDSYTPDGIAEVTLKDEIPALPPVGTRVWDYRDEEDRELEVSLIVANTPFDYIRPEGAYEIILVPETSALKKPIEELCALAHWGWEVSGGERAHPALKSATRNR